MWCRQGWLTLCIGAQANGAAPAATAKEAGIIARGGERHGVAQPYRAQLRYL